MERFFVKIKNNVYFKIDNLLAVIAEFLSHSYGFDFFYSWRFDGKVCHYSFFNEESDDITCDYGNVKRSNERYYEVLTISVDGETIVSYKKPSRIITRVKGMVQDIYYGMDLSDHEILTIVGDLTKKYPELKKLEDALVNKKDVRIKDLTFGIKLVKE